MEEACKLVAVGFEFVCDIDGKKLSENASGYLKFI